MPCLNQTLFPPRHFIKTQSTRLAIEPLGGAITGLTGIGGRGGSTAKVALTTSCALFFAALWCLLLVRGEAMTLPPGFIEEEVGSLWTEPVGVAFDRDPRGANRVYAWERAGRVWILENGVNSFVPLLDIRDEVGSWNDYGMLGFALDPDFQHNGYIYVSYVVDRHHLLHAGTPQYDPAKNEYFAATIGRVTRYTARASDGFRTVDPASRRVLVGETIDTGIPILHGSHGPGALVFGEDGTLLVACGDAASWEALDDGGAKANSRAPQGLVDGIIRPKEDVGAFRAQLIDSLSGKILRLDPATGDGVASNPFFDPQSPRAAKSRVWALGVRNPYRMTLRPDTGSHLPADGDPGVIVLGDVGWSDLEEINVIDGPGQNCGWPLFQGLVPDPTYATSTAENLDAPNPLGGFFQFKDLLVQETRGVPSWPNPKDPAQQIPAGLPKFMHHRPVIDVGRDLAANGPARAATFNGDTATETKIGAPGSPIEGPQFLANASTGGVFYEAADFPAGYQGSYFHADYGQGWIKNIVFDANHRPVQVTDFATGGHPVFIGTHPTRGGIYYVDMSIPAVRKISYAPGGNRLPLVTAKVSKSIGASPLSVQFSSAGSSDPEKSVLKYLWEFGDGTTSTAANPLHVFTATGTQRFDVRLTVTDAKGGSTTATTPVFVNHSLPRVDILSPIGGTKYPLAGNTEYRLTRRVIEVANHPTTTRWNVYLRHENHEHSEPAVTTNEAVATLSPAFSADEIFSYRIHLTVTDDLGATVEREVRLFPDAANLAPQLTWSLPSQRRQPGAGALILDVGAQISDADSLGIESGELRIDCSQPDALTIAPIGDALGEVNVAGAAVRFGGVEVGTLGTAPGTLTVRFNDAATPAAARAILRRVAGDFSSAGIRTITASVNDGDGGTSAAAVLAMNVSDTAPPTLRARAILGQQVPGEAEGTTYARLTAPSAGGFGGAIKKGAVVIPAIFAADGSVRVKVGDFAPGLGGAKFLTLNAPSGDAALGTLAIGPGRVTAGNDAVLVAGLTVGSLRIVAREGMNFANAPAIFLTSFGAIDGNAGPGGAIFFLAKVRGVGLTPAAPTALCAALADGSVRLLVRQGESVGGKPVTIIGTLLGSAGTLGEGRWRADATTIGARLTFSDSTHALVSIPAATLDASGRTVAASSGAAGSTIDGAKIQTFGLPGFGPAGLAAAANLQTTAGAATTANDRAIFAANAAGISRLARESFAAAGLPPGTFKTLADPIAGASGGSAFVAGLTRAGLLAPVASVWFSPAGAAAKRIAEAGENAPGGGRFAAFSSLVLPDAAENGPAFTASLRIDAAARISAANNFGLWSADAAGIVHLVLRTEQLVIVQGRERVVKSFTAFTPVPGAIGAASGHDESAFHISAKFVDGGSALLILPAR